MERDSKGNKVFSSSLEAMIFLDETSREIVAWIHKCLDEGAVLPAFPHYRSRLNDISMITQRFIENRERKINALQDKLDNAITSSLCPRCRQPKRQPETKETP
jgi:hypothetical protein